MKIVLEDESSGLGDWLVRSTLPQGWVEEGHEVYLSGRQFFRSPTVRDLILLNPYIKGLSDDEPVRPEITHGIPWKAHHLACHSNEQAWFGRTYTDGLPTIGYQPVLKPEWSNAVVANFTSGRDHTDGYDFFIQDALRQMGNIPVEEVVVLRTPGDGEHGRNVLPDNRRYDVSSLWELADIIASARERLFVIGGAVHLAAAVRAPATVMVTTSDYNAHVWTYEGFHRYLVTGKPSEDLVSAWLGGYSTQNYNFHYWVTDRRCDRDPLRG